MKIAIETANRVGFFVAAYILNQEHFHNTLCANNRNFDGRSHKHVVALE
mgnify:CR=1 FL=1